jgi:endonuclease/exonuclease/phosphatase family metal-dependent hydrolase
MTHARLYRLVESSSVLLFFLQALRVVFSVLFGIIYDQVFEGPMSAWLVISVALVLVALLSPLGLLRMRSIRWPAILAILAGLARITLCINDPDIRYWGALIVVAAGAMYLASRLALRSPSLFTAFVCALSLGQVLQAVGQTYDISLRQSWLPVQVLWAAAVVVAAMQSAKEHVRHGSHAGLSAGGGFILGGVLFLETSLLSLPHAVARWAAQPYVWSAPTLLLATLLPGLPGVRVRCLALLRSHGYRTLLALGVAIGVMLGYFLRGPVSLAALVLTQAGVIVLLAYLFESGQRASPGPPVALGLAVFLVLNFLNAFAFTYPYTLPALRGLGWAVYLTACVLVAVGLLPLHALAPPDSRKTRAPAGVWAGLVAALAITLAVAWPATPDALPTIGTIRLATYNIHYGYDDAWHFTLDEQAQLIEDERVDVIALQEVDTGRLTSYAVDDARYLARRLRMNVAYLPTVEHLTGIALLYHGEPEAVEAALLPSLQEQTGIVRVSLNPDGHPLAAHAIWMGLSDEDTQRQIESALAFIGAETPASFGGDFNATPDSPVAQAVRQAGFQDPFEMLSVDPAPLTDPADSPVKRIDFVWLRGLDPIQAWVPESLASDHRMVVVEVRLTP